VKARRLFLAGNWKMHKTPPEAAALARALLAGGAGELDAVDVALCPPFVALPAVAEALRGSRVALGAQNMHWEPQGAFTGEVSAAMLTAAGCRHVILGHSERRKFFGETNETVSRRLRAALAAGLFPIVCVGETLEERKAGRTHEVIRDHVEGSLAGADAGAMAKVTIAYEPVWAIGTGVNATPEQAEEAQGFLRGLLAERFGRAVAEETRIQYGGSVKAANAGALLACPDVDGALVGGASLEAKEFLGILRAAEALGR
jgi:triosephosphate isomerase